MNHDTILWLVGIAAEAVVVFLCIRQKFFRERPIFAWYVVWSLLIDVGFYYLRQILSPNSFFNAYVPQMIVDAIFQFGVLVELGWAVLKPIRPSLPKHSIYMLAVLILVTGAVIWPLAAWTVPQQLTAAGRLYVHLLQTVSALRVIIFVAMACFSQLLSIGWRNRELQIATGFGIYSMCRLAVSVLDTHGQFDNKYYDLLEQIVVASYDFSLVYWIFSFAQTETERQEFSPKMQNFLLALAGAARTTRIAVAQTGGKHSSRP